MKITLTRIFLYKHKLKIKEIQLKHTDIVRFKKRKDLNVIGNLTEVFLKNDESIFVKDNEIDIKYKIMGASVSEKNLLWYLKITILFMLFNSKWESRRA